MVESARVALIVTVPVVLLPRGTSAGERVTDSSDSGLVVQATVGMNNAPPAATVASMTSAERIVGEGGWRRRRASGRPVGGRMMILAEEMV